MSTGLVSSLYADQGDQPLAVHAEEVVEETVVSCILFMALHKKPAFKTISHIGFA